MLLFHTETAAKLTGKILQRNQPVGLHVKHMVVHFRNLKP